MDKCKDCKFKEQVGYAVHECRRFPPTVYCRGGDVVSSYPEIDENDWCGEFKHKPTKEQIELLEALEVIDRLGD